MKFMVEISRGCPCMCRFCWAGYNYLPVRGFTRAEIVGRAREVRARHEQDRPRLDRGLRPPGDRRDRGRPGRPRLRGLGGLAAPRRPHAASSSSSWRTPASRASPSPPSAAPTACGEILNKQFTNEEILDKATWIFENGIQNLKLYYMVGLPVGRARATSRPSSTSRSRSASGCSRSRAAAAASAASTRR